MASLRDIKRKIRVVKNIAQITQAMKMVAAAKLRRVQDRVQKGKPYAQTMAELVGTLAPSVKDFSHPLLEVREIENVTVVVIAGDKGLCGAYNSNILRLGQKFVDEQIAQYGAPNVRLLTIGKKAGEYFRKRGYEPSRHFGGIGPDTPYEEIRAISNELTGSFSSRATDEVFICYTEFVTALTQRPETIKFLPIEPPSAGDEVEETAGSSDFIFEPKIDELLSKLLPALRRNAHLPTVDGSHSLGVRRAHDGDEQRHQERQRTDRQPDADLQPHAPGEHHQRTARYYRRRRGVERLI